MNKVQLRKHIANILDGLSLAEKQEQSRIVFAKLIEHPKYHEAKRLSIYLSTDNEIDTTPILRHALEVDKKQCFIPLVRTTKIQYNDETRMIMAELNSMKEYEELPLNRYGIKEPKDALFAYKRANPLDENNDFLDLMIVPGVAFARDGRRLGHGRGYYDEYLADWSKRAPKPLYTIGLALKEQIVVNPLAVDGHDYTLDEILTA